MSLDGIAIMALVRELNEKLIGSRIDKIYQPHKYETILQIRSVKDKLSLLLSANPESPRIHLTGYKYENPSSPPMFCMLLRKYLSHGKIIAVSQPGVERMVRIGIENTDEIGNARCYELILEIMGRHSNLILIDKEDHKILGCMKYVTTAISRRREILPGIPYENPPEQHKFNPFLLSESTFMEIFFNIQSPKNLWNVFLDHIAGMSPQLVKEIIFRANLSPATLIWNKQDILTVWNMLQTFLKKTQANAFEPVIILQNGLPKYFSPFALKQYEDAESCSFSTLNEAVDGFFYHKQQAHKLMGHKQMIQRIIEQHLSRLRKKYSLQIKTYETAQHDLDTQKYGELITAHLYQIEPGEEKIEVIDYYDPEQKKISILMDPYLSPVQNAQKYFSRYTKAKNTIAATQNIMSDTKSDIDYLEGVLVNLEDAQTQDELEEIKKELIKEKFMKASPSKAKKSKEPPLGMPSQPLHITSRDGWDIYVGKNNRQNDLLTFKIADPDDLWFHTKDIPGSHVVVKIAPGKTIPLSTIEEAACLAARHSKAKNDTKVPVDYTLRKHVRKPKGAKPGFVLYDHHKNIVVNPTTKA